MKILQKMISSILAVALCLCILPVGGFAAPPGEEKQGNSDLNIQNGGIMLKDGDNFYFSDKGIFVQNGETVRPISADAGKNLNLYNGYLYYTLGEQVKRSPLSGGVGETIHTASGKISQLYVIDGELRYVANGTAFSVKQGSKIAERSSQVAEVTGLIPTKYGDLLLSGEAFNKAVWANEQIVLTGVTSCYTDGDYLVLLKNKENYMVKLSKLFKGFDENNDLENFNLHGTVSLSALLAADDNNTVSEYNENDQLQGDYTPLLQQAGLLAEDAATPLAPEVRAGIIPPVSQGQRNIVKRARQLSEIQWTPLEDRSQWGNRGVFKAETTYTGIAYGQPINNNGYLGYGVSLETYAAAVLDNTSKFYTTYSTYNKIAPAYSTDCSGYVSYAWGLPQRRTTYSIPGEAQKVGDQSIYSLQIGDCLNEAVEHVVLVSDVTYDAEGNIIGVEIMEQTPVITKKTRYGNGEAKSLASLQAYYLNGGYIIYRNPNRDLVTYTPSPVVPLDGETVDGMKDPAPKSRTSAYVGGKSVALTSETPGATIYYTTDGTVPTTSSPTFSMALSFNQTTKLRAIAVTGKYQQSTILEYTVKIPQAQKPTATVSSGQAAGNVVSPGSQISLSATNGGSVYYTLDGTEPTSSSLKYSSPITINAPTTIKAMVEGIGMSRSETAVLSYKPGTVFTISASAGSGGKIAPSGDTAVLETGSASYTITPDKDFLIADVLVDGKSVGAVGTYTFTDVRAKHSISASFKSATVQGPFTDVPPNAWYYNAVAAAYSAKLFNGTSDTTFSPEAMMTRGMFVTVLGRVAGLPADLKPGLALVTGTGVNIRSGPSTTASVAGFVENKNSLVQVISKSGDWYNIKYRTVTGFIRQDLLKVYNKDFTDLPASAYYSPSVEWAYLNGIANGTTASTFSPDANIQREQMCVLLYRYALSSGKTLPKTIPLANFKDDSTISDGAKPAVYALQQAGVINGMGDGGFYPKSTATRAQVAQIFTNFVNAVK
ncbi:MAG: S-layer homology domain-containing protein [Oscillospiraceae bacterium]